ncbi:MAG: hypothetical protein K2J76_06600 [Oscillospiraceae bacterium]|nr:hypothetical protein [Oscillospiraceae bacterium]
MKKAALITLLLLMLGGCGNNSELSTETVSETLPTSSVTTNTDTEDTTTTVTTTATSATTAAETTVTEETTTGETTAVTEPKPPEPVIPPEATVIDVGKFYEGEQYYFDYTILDDENILVLYKFHDGSGGFVKFSAAAAKIFGISDGEEKAHIDLPVTNADFVTVENAEWYNFYRTKNNTSNVCCAIYSGENDSNRTTETVIYNDFTYENGEFGDLLSYYGSVIRTAGDHMAIISRYDNFYDTESGEIILNSIYEGDESKSTYRCGYEFPIDENSFVYHMWGYEWSHCFGIYDYLTGTARNVPNTVDTHPIAAHNGKIYSYYGDPDYTEHVIYATDVKTLETTPLFELDENDDPGDYRMPPNGEFLYKCYSNSFTVYDPDNLNIIKKYEFENTYIRNWDVRFTGDGRAVLLDEKQKCLYILELNK